MNDVTKMIEEAEHLSTTLNFIKKCCRNMECETCYFHDEKDCIFGWSPEDWNIEAVMLNVGRAIGRREAE